MHFSTIFASIATLSAVSALPTSIFLPVGNLPSQPTTGGLVLKDLNNLDSAITTLVSSLTSLDYTKDITGNSKEALTKVVENTIACQTATQTSRLNAKGINAKLSPSDSVAIVDKLTEGVATHLQEVKDLVAKAKASGILATITVLPGLSNSILEPLGLADYLDLFKTDTAGFGTSLLPYIDPASLPDAEAVIDTINNLVTATVELYTTP